MNEKELLIYQTPGGKEPFTRWRKMLKDKVTLARIDRRLERLSAGQYGDYKLLPGGVCELRLFFGPGYRIYFAEDGERLVLLLCGGDKGSQSKDIEAAQAYWLDYQRDRDEANTAEANTAEVNTAEVDSEQADPEEETQ